MDEKKDTRSRKWLITINNPEEKGFTHERIKEELNNIKSIVYWCLCDEIGLKTHTYHTHILIFRSGAIRFSTLQKRFPPGSQLDMLRGTLQQTRDYIRKEGKYKVSAKEETNLKDTFEESGVVPDEHQGQRNDLVALYDMIKEGKSNFDILEDNPNYMLQLEKVERCREILRYEEFKNIKRDVHVEYWYGKEGTGKTSGVFERYGSFDKVYRVVDSKNPWDDYRGQDVVMFDDFRDYMFDITLLLRWLDVYPLELSCRYSNKMACYTKVYFTSNVPFENIYHEVQRYEPDTWKAFCRRIHCIKEFNDKGIVDYQNMDDYLNRYKTKDGFIRVPVAEQRRLDELFGKYQ